MLKKFTHNINELNQILNEYLFKITEWNTW